MSHGHVLKPDYRPEIDGLRAVAVLAVLLFHLGIEGFGGGFVGVDVFFVISGFLITRILITEISAGNFRFANFYERRVRRIVPSQLAALVLTALGAFLLFSPEDFLKFSDALMATLLFVSNIYFWREIGYFTADVDIKPLLHMWSLSVEEQFYLLWPLLIVALMTRKWRGWLPLVGILLAGASLVAAIVWAGRDPNAAFYLLPFRVFEFVIGGAMVFALRYRFPHPWLNEIVFLLGLALIFYAIAFYSVTTPFPSYFALVPCLGAALIIFAGSAPLSRWVLANRVMVYLGLISYQIYLIHWPLIVFFKYRAFAPMTILEQMFVTAITLVISVLIYHGIDRPCRPLSTAHGARAFRVEIGCAVGAVVLAIFALSIRLDYGWTWRLDEKYRALVNSPTDFHRTQYGGSDVAAKTILTLGNVKSPPAFIMFGDSFAAQYAHGLTDFLNHEQRSAKAYFNHACMILPGVQVQDRGALKRDCQDAFALTQSLWAGNNLPIIIAHSWHTYKDQLAGSDGLPLQFSDEVSYYQFIFARLDALITEIGPNRPLILLGIAPGIKDQKPIARCFRVPTYLPNDCAAHVRVPEGELKNGVTFNRMAAEFAARRPTVTFLNPYRAFCTEGGCSTIDADKIFYSDAAHLSKDGSSRAVKYFEQEFRELLSSLPPLPAAAP
jgi:peptidoglycan/LPS O-acetylase OafA/YrhL